MTDEISYFDVAAFLAEIEPDYARAYSFQTYLRDCAAMRGEGRVVAAVRDRWPCGSGSSRRWGIFWLPNA
jgi:hypothetical protein